MCFRRCRKIAEPALDEREQRVHDAVRGRSQRRGCRETEQAPDEEVVPYWIEDHFGDAAVDPFCHERVSHGLSSA